MHHGVDPAHDAKHVAWPRHVGRHKTCLFVKGSHVSEAQLVQAFEPAGKMPPDIAGGARDQYTHESSFIRATAGLSFPAGATRARCPAETGRLTASRPGAARAHS